MARKKSNFTFAISLSVLNHLGRNLYRSFVTVLGEAISNAWDADAQTVKIVIDKKNNRFAIVDDGIGMDDDDFQEKFLKIGYSKRKHGKLTSGSGRPFIGRKGIGKLALLSCAEKITVISKKQNKEIVGGIIDNSGLDQAITDDLKPQDYQLGEVDFNLFELYTRNLSHGTAIIFIGINDGIKNSLDYLKKIVALNFRFSLLDPGFSIYINEEKIEVTHLSDLAKQTQFLWKINHIDDPFICLVSPLEEKQISNSGTYFGFIASVEKPKDLKVISEDEKVGIDLFVNGRLREKDILKHIPTARVVESYLYGQIHCNDLDDDIDRFTSSREGVVADDPKYSNLLNEFKVIIDDIMKDWDIWRVKHKKSGDPDNDRFSKKERTTMELYNVVSDEYRLPQSSENQSEVDQWINSLSEDARYNFGSYADCFISENLIRKFIDHKKIPLSPEAQRELQKYKTKESESKAKGNISIEIRKNLSDLSYLAMDDLAYLVDKNPDNSKPSLSRDSREYKPIRDALMHTASLTDEAKTKLRSVYDNIKGRIIQLLS
jgi:hypothetical protein